MEVNNLGLYIVGSFLVINLLLGLWAGRNVKDIRDYAIGNKRWGVGALVMTYIATIFGGGFIFLDSKGYYFNGIGSFIACLGIPISHLIRSLFLSKRITNRENFLTLGDFMEHHYGKYAKILSGFLGFIFNFITLATQVKMLGFIFENFLSVDPTLSIIISGLVIVIYSSFGGINAVVSTDILQFIFLMIALFLISSLTVNKAGGAKAIFLNLTSDRLQILNHPQLPNFISLFLINAVFQTEMIHPARFQRLLMAQNSGKIKKMFFYISISSFIIFGMLAIMSYAATILYPECNGEFILPVFYDIVPNTFKPVIVIGLISLVFSSADSFLHSATLSLGLDLCNPLLKNKISSSKILSCISILIGVIGIFMAFSQIVLSRSMIILGILAPIISSPALFAIVGIKISKRNFWISTLLTIIFFIFCNINLLGPTLHNYSVLFSTSLNCVLLILFKFILDSHINICSNNSGKVKIESLQPKVNESHQKTYFANIYNKINSSTELYKPDYTLFSIFYVGILLIPYIFTDIQNMYDNYILIYLKAIALTLCSLLITHSIWPSSLKKYRPAFWYITLTYCLPFLGTIMLIMSHGAMEYTINIAINIMFLLLLVDWASAIGIGLVGTAAAIGYYKFFIQADPLEAVFGFETKYLLIYQIIFGTIIGLLFARKKHIRIKSLDENTDFLEELQQNIIETNNMSIAIAEDANRTPENINLHPAENVEALKNLLQEKNLLSSEISQKITELEIFIAAEEKNISPYMVLNVNKIPLIKIAEKLESFSKSCACENTYISIYSKETFIKCDSSQIIKCIGKLAQNYYHRMKTFYDEDSDIFLNITLIDTKIKYISATDSKISREINGLAIVLSENENLEDTFTNKNFEKVMIDPEKIPSTRLKDHKMIDIERTIDAHYGILQTIENEENLSYICVLPINVYDIRPITLDLDAPNISELSYDWPSAEGLETKFWEKVSSINTVSTNKIKKAIDYTKIYHRHQTRKSGEPYYLHPMNVAMIAIDIAQQHSEIQTLLMENIETVILVSLLHDILEDTYIKRKNILQNFGGEVLRYIESVTKNNFKQREFLLSNEQAFTKLINQEPITICVKIADRIHNLQTIDGHTKVEKRIAVAEETLIFFTQAARKYRLIELAEKLTSVCNYIIKNEQIEGWKT